MSGSSNISSGEMRDYRLACLELAVRTGPSDHRTIVGRAEAFLMFVTEAPRASAQEEGGTA